MKYHHAFFSIRSKDKIKIQYKPPFMELSFDITEKLRGRDTEGCEELLAKVEEQYNNTVDAIHMMED